MPLGAAQVGVDIKEVDQKLAEPALTLRQTSTGFLPIKNHQAAQYYPS